MILSFRKNGEVVMLGQGVRNESLDFIELPDDPRMKQGYQMKIKDGQIEYEKPWWMLKEENKEQMKKDFEKDLKEVEKAKDLNELKPLLEKLLRKNYNQ